jgi:protein TonB
MSVRADASTSSLDWQRVTALSTTFAMHVIAVAVVAIPIAMPLPRILPKVARATVFETKPPPVLPIPPEPLPLPHPHPSHHPVVAPPVPRVPVATTTSPIESPTATTPVASAPASAAPTNAPTSPAGGETRTLAYDSALRLRYPATSVRQREQGTVLLRVLVDAGGAVQRIEVERSSGHPQLDTAAREAVQRAHFRPVLRDGQAVPAWGIVPIEFRLDRA